MRTCCDQAGHEKGRHLMFWGISNLNTLRLILNVITNSGLVCINGGTGRPWWQKRK
jgi:hypothetical protein